MANKVNLHYPVPPVQPGKNKSSSTSNNSASKSDFKEILQKQLANEKIKFSGHCLKRMQQNNINFSPGQIDRLASAVNKAQLKGAKESLVIMDNMALVVSIKNKTVITAVDSQRMKENVFTNIDSAVII